MCCVKPPTVTNKEDFFFNSVGIENHLTITNGLYIAIDGHTVFEVTNKSGDEQTLCLDQPIEVAPYNEDE